MYSEAAIASIGFTSSVRQNHVADAQPWRTRLRERGREDDVATTRQLVHARERIARVPHQAIGIVLVDQEALGLRELDERLPLLQRQRPPSWVLEGGNRVEDLWRLRVRAEQRLERIEVESRVRKRNRFDPGADVSQDADRAVIARRFDDDATSVREQVTHEEVESGERARRDHHLGRLDTMLRGDRLSQRLVAAGRPVVQDRSTLAGDDRLRTLAQCLDRKDVGRRVATSEGDHVHGRSV